MSDFAVSVDQEKCKLLNIAQVQKKVKCNYAWD